MSAPVALTATRPVQEVDFADNAIFAGGCPYSYDGQFVSEAGFHTYPDDGKITLTPAAGGGATAGKYSFVFTYEYEDAGGRKWQSVASVPKAVTLTANQKVTCVVPTDRLTRRFVPVLGGASGTLVSVVGYATEANGSIYYRFADIANNRGIDTVSIEHTVADSVLILNLPLSGFDAGVLENGPWPACRLLEVHQNRLFFGGLENPYEVQYTEELREGFSPNTDYAETGKVYSLVVSPDFGEVTGLKSMDDKLVIFCERGMWFIHGQGPNRLGQFNAYSVPLVASADVGCHIESPDSTVLTPMGIWFRSVSGLRLLTRGMTVAKREGDMFLGAEVDSAVDGCKATYLVRDRHQIRFYTGTVCIVYDYQFDQWSKFTNYAAVDAAFWLGLNVHLRSDGTLYEAGGDTHAGTAFHLKVITAWLKFAGVQGFQRVYELLVLGGYFADGTIRFEVGYDYTSNWSAMDSNTTSLLTTDSAIFQVRHKFAQQKCSAVRFRVSELNSGNAGFSLSNFAVQVGIKRGASKLSNTRTT